MKNTHPKQSLDTNQFKLRSRRTKKNIFQIGPPNRTVYVSLCQFMSEFVVSRGCFLYMSSDDNSCTNKQTFKWYDIFPSSNRKHRSLPESDNAGEL